MTPIEIISNFFIVALLGGAILYLHRKFKNIADKEDLNNLTDIVEEVKQKYRSENEALKAQLDLLNDRKIQVFTEEKDAIILFHTKIYEWIWDKLDIALFEYGLNRTESLSDKIIEMNDTYHQVNVLFSKVSLLVDDNDLILAGHDVIISALKLHQLVEDLCQSYKHWLGASKVTFDVFMESTKKNPTQPFDASSIKLAKEIDSELEKIRKEYLEKKPALFTETLESVHKFKNMAKKYIRTP